MYVLIQKELKLILTGFSEATHSLTQLLQYNQSNKTLHFEYSTTKGINKL